MGELESEPSKTIIQTYVWHGEEAFFVSTIERNTSAMMDPPLHRYNETIVWRWNPKTRERGEQIFMDSAFRGSIKIHQACVERLFNIGLAKNPEDDS